MLLRRASRGAAAAVVVPQCRRVHAFASTRQALAPWWRRAHNHRRGQTAADAQREAAAARAAQRAFNEHFDKQRYHTLLEYLLRLPLGLRALLLCSPALALAYFVAWQQRDYYLDEGEALYCVLMPWRRRSATPLLRHAPPAAAATASCSASLLPVLDDDSSSDTSVARTPATTTTRATSPPVPAFVTWSHQPLQASQPPPPQQQQKEDSKNTSSAATMAASPLGALRIVRDKHTGRVVGYTTVTA